jgi:hypothetical protein
VISSPLIETMISPLQTGVRRGEPQDPWIGTWFGIGSPMLWSKIMERMTPRAGW